MSGSAQAGPSTRITTINPLSEVIDLTLDEDDEEEEDSLPPLISHKRNQRRQPSVNSLGSSIVETSPPQPRERKPNIGDMLKERTAAKGKQVDRMSHRARQVAREEMIVPRADKGKQVDRRVPEGKTDKGKQVVRGRTSATASMDQMERSMTANTSTRFENPSSRPRLSSTSIPPADTAANPFHSAAPIPNRQTVKDKLMGRRSEHVVERRKPESSHAIKDAGDSVRELARPVAGPSRYTSLQKLSADGPPRIVSSTSKAASRTANPFLPGLDPGSGGSARPSTSPQKASRLDRPIAGPSRVPLKNASQINDPFQPGRSTNAATASSSRSKSPQKAPEQTGPSTGSSTSHPTSRPVKPHADMAAREDLARSRLSAALQEEHAGSGRPIAGSSRVAKSKTATSDRARAQMESRTLTKTVSGSSSGSFGGETLNPGSSSKSTKPAHEASQASRPVVESSRSERSELVSQLNNPLLSVVDRAILKSKVYSLSKSISGSSSDKSAVKKSNPTATSSTQSTTARPSKTPIHASTSTRLPDGEASRPPAASSSSHAMAKTASGRSVTSNSVQRPHKASIDSVPMAKTISSTSNNSHQDRTRRLDDHTTNPRASTSKGTDRSESPIKRASTSTEGRGLVPGPREKQKPLATEERGRTEKRDIGDGRGIKRNRSAAFGTHGKPDRPAGSRIQGRQMDIDSSAEVSRILSPGKLADTPQSAQPASRPMRRTDSLGSAARATPTPPARPIPAIFRAPVYRRETLLKESTSARNSASRQPSTRPTEPIRPSTPPRQTAKPANISPSGKKTFPLFSPGYRAPQPEISPRQRRKAKANTSPRQTKHADNASTDPSYKSNGKAKGKPAEEEEEEVEEDPSLSRPKRARPAPGTYTVPSMDDPKWPTRNGSSGSEPQGRGRNRSTKAAKAQGVAASSSLDQISEGASNTGKSVRTVVSASAHASARPEKQDPRSTSPRKRQDIRLPPSRTRRSITESTYASDIAAAILGPHKTEPATPKSRGERLATQTPRTLSKLSVESRVSRLKTPTRRRTRPPTLTPKSTLDGPIEEEEPIENIPPTPSQPEKVNEDDVLAMFADYQFDVASPEQSLKDGVTHTPKSNGGPSTPRTATRTTTVPGSHRSALADTTDLNATPSAKRPLVADSSFAGLSPKRVRADKPAPRNFLAGILADAEAAEASAIARRLENETQREARQRRVAAFMEDTSVVELQDLSAIDFTDAVPAEDNKVDENAREDSIASRRSDRVRTASLGTAKTKPPSSIMVDTKAGVRKDKKPPKPVPTVADNFFAHHRVAALHGVQVGDADRALQAISRSTSPKKPDISADENDPLSPLSEEESDNEGSSDGVRLDLLEHNEDISGLLHVAQEVRDSTRTSARQSALPQCDIFWSSQPVKQATPKAIVSSPTALADLSHHISPVLASVLVPALTDPIDEPTSYEEAFAETDINKRSVLIANLLRETAISPSAAVNDPEVIAGFETYWVSTWVALGARPELFKDVPGKEDVPVSPLLVSLSREEASSLLCQSIALVVQNRWMEVASRRFLIPILLLLKVDSGSSLALRRTIDDTLDLLWVASVWDSSALAPCPTSAANGAISIAMDLHRQTRSLPCSVQTSVLLAIGQTTIEARLVARWYAVEILSPGCLEALDEQLEHQTPGVNLIIQGAERIVSLMNEPVPNFDQIDDLVTCLYTVLSDIDTLVQITPYNTSGSNNLHPIMDLRALLIKIHHTLKAPGEDDLRLQVSHTKARLAQLAIIVEMQFETAFTRLKRDKARAKLGNGLKEGKDGQAMLAFSRQPSVSV